VRQEELADYAPVNEIKMPFLFAHSLLPKSLGSGVDYSFLEMVSIFNMFRKMAGSIGPAFKGVDTSKGMGALFNMDAVRQGETSSANGNCSARGLATIGAAMANGGSLGGVKVLGEKGWKALHADPTPGGLGFAPDNPLDMTYFTQGGVNEYPDSADSQGSHLERAGYYGWLGYGGSVFQWNLRHKIGFAYVPTVLEFHCMHNMKGARFQEEVVRCARRLEERKSGSSAAM